MNQPGFKGDLISDVDSQQSKFAIAEAFHQASAAPEADLKAFKSLADKLPDLPSDPKASLLTIRDLLQQEHFGYEFQHFTLHDLMATKRGNCLGLSLLVSSLLESHNRHPEIKLLIHPQDVIHEQDQKLFSALMQGEYFSYDAPELPDLTEQPDPALRVNRFAALSHPIVTLDGVPFETTLIEEKNANILMEFPSEQTIRYSTEQLVSFVYSDQAKDLIPLINSTRGAKNKKLVARFTELVNKSLEIDPTNVDALELQWTLAGGSKDVQLQAETIAKLKALNLDNSQYNAQMWAVTGDQTYLDKSIEQFPENIYTFIDKRVFMEKDPREAKFNLAVALWCVYYSNCLDIQTFVRNKSLRRKIEQLYPNHPILRIS